MINTIITYKHQIFYWLLAMVAMSLSFPSYSLVSQAIIGLGVFWLFFYNSLSEKAKNIKKNYKLFLLVFAPYLLALFGLLNTNNTTAALHDLKLKLPFLIIPLILFSVVLKPKTNYFVAKYISYAIVVALILALSIALYLKINDLGSFLFYAKYSELIGKHSTSTALIIVMALLFFVYSFIKSDYRSYINLVLVGFLLFNLYLLSNRTSIIALTIGSLILFFYMLPVRAKWFLAVLVFILVLFIYNLPNFQKRFNPNYIEDRSKSDIELRKDHWKSVLQTIQHENIFFGTGTAADKPYLYEKYRFYGIETAYKNKYNAHNQFLEFALENGIIGFILFILSLFYIYKKLVLKKNYYAIAVFSSILIFMLTESLLERQSGIVVYSLFISLFLQNNHVNEEK